MKHLFFALFISLSLVGEAQKNEPISYTEVVTIDSVSKDELYIRARNWVNDAFRSAKDVIQISDKETGELAGKGLLYARGELKWLATYPFKGMINFSFKILLKDGKYKYEFSDFNNTDCDFGHPGAQDFKFGLITTSNTASAKYWGYSQKKMDDALISMKASMGEKVKDMIASLKESMNKKPEDF